MILPSRAIPVWALYSLSDGLWVYSLTSYLLLVWEGKNRGWAALWIHLGFVLGCGSEILQAFRVLPGRFDGVDLWACWIGWRLALVLPRVPSLPLRPTRPSATFGSPSP